MVFRETDPQLQILTIHWIIGVHTKHLELTLFSKAFDSIDRGKMEQILLAYGLPKETVTIIKMFYKNMKAKVHSLDGDTDFFNINIISIYNLPRLCTLNINRSNERKWLYTKKKGKKQMVPCLDSIGNTKHANDIAILKDTPTQAESLLHSLEQPLDYTWIQTKLSTYVLIKKETSPFSSAVLWSQWTTSHTSVAASPSKSMDCKW